MAYMKKVVDNKKGSGFVNLATGAKVITYFLEFRLEYDYH